MSTTAAEQEEIEEQRLPSPHLDFTGRVRSILDGDDSILSPSTEVPSIPQDVSDMDIHDSIEEDNNDGIVENPPRTDEVVEEIT